MNIPKAEFDYYKIVDSRNEKFWKRSGGMPDLKGKVILDVGCGHGSLCFYMANSGAKKVIGLDIDSDRIYFAKEYLDKNYPEYSQIIEFHETDLKDYLPEEQFDYIVSKDSFEHIIDLQGMIGEIKLRLKPGGLLYVGFGPLYNDFYGDHKRTKCIIPWGHVMFSNEKILKRLNKKRKIPIQSIFELGLNMLSLADYLKIFQNSGLTLVKFEVNVSNNIILRVFVLITYIFPFLKEYFAHNIYAILKKEEIIT
jgi:2-polyprenyl-3-methyl-5-hydroxy-6-metoxy-1,4-benzoquinol methylase